ncbi:hypothetical protein D777_01614 [Marinobacter nitratireducens]|uniref:Uncharacterized protein n=1 Tax=Marinobacter nitratireducens TaxID=1137280 RepID=A0A072NDV3_9GAMM|nr:hypothetical protein D777_01614 [Marinobacter nitratireducens]
MFLQSLKNHPFSMGTFTGTYRAHGKQMLSNTQIESGDCP